MCIISRESTKLGKTEKAMQFWIPMLSLILYFLYLLVLDYCCSCITV